MATCSEVVKHYKNLPGQHVQEMWNQIHKRGMKGDLLRDILMFYLHHKIFPPPLQKSFEILLQTFSAKGTSKKMKIVMFHVIEELSLCLESSVVETINFSPSSSLSIELLNSILVGGLVPLLDEAIIEKLFSLLQSQDISSEERGKLLSFLCQAIGSCPVVFSRDHVARICREMSVWLRELRPTVMPSSTLLIRSNSTSGTEVDGTVAGELFTVLTLANSFSDSHLMDVHTFCLLCEWLGRVVQEQNTSLSEAVREYCSLVVEQCFRLAQHDHDVALQKAVLCEVLDVLNQLVLLDRSQASQCLLVVKRVQTNVTEKFKSDYRDISIFVRVLNFLLNFGETTGYNSQLFCEKFLGDVVYRSYSSGLAAFDIAIFLVDSQHKIAPALLQRFFPNLLKLVACHPAVLIEEFMALVPMFVAPHITVEVFHSLVDLPVLSATLCLHQAPVVMQLDHTHSLDVPWLALLESARSTPFRATFSHVMRQESGQDNVLERIPAYLELLNDLCTHALVATCSQVAPVLLDTFLSHLESCGRLQELADIILAMLSRLRLLYNVPGYTIAIHRCICKHVNVILKLCPELVFTIQTELMEYISVLNNSTVCPQLYIKLVWAVGEYSSTGFSDRCNHELLVKYYETLECVLYETLNLIMSQETISLQLLNVTYAALTKLASRCQDLIPRVMLCLSKVRTQVASGLTSTAAEDKKIVFDRIEELLCLLRNPNIAAVVFSSSHENNPAMSAMVRVLAQFTDS